jgi:putative DNA primase/helicase
MTAFNEYPDPATSRNGKGRADAPAPSQTSRGQYTNAKHRSDREVAGQDRTSSSKAGIAAIAGAALSQAEYLVPRWVPDGRREGREWVARNPTRQDAHLGSFKANLETGVWCDFATGDKGGDLVSLYAYLNRLRQGEAARELAQELGLESRLTERPYKQRSHSTPYPTLPPKAQWQPLIPVPESAPAPPKAHPKHGVPSSVWTYRDERRGAVPGVAL